jgi:hypothetical protein
MRRHQLWLIRNQPRLDVTATPWCLIDPKIDNLGYTRGKEAWIEHTQKNPHDAVVLANAARFIAVTEPAYAERLLKRAIVADPSNPKWHVQMGSLLIKLGHAEMVTDELDTALGLTSELQKMSVLFDAAEVALEAGKFAKAKDYANAAFDMAHASRDPMRGASIHRAHIIEGRIALAAGSVVVARFHLLEAGNTPIPKPLNAFGPNMTLARELLAKGERQAVARYIELCSTWWQPEDDRLIRWKAEIESTGSLSTAPTDQ